MTDSYLREMFGYKAPTEEQQRSCVALRTHFHNLAALLLANSPPSRAQSVALTELQSACRAAMAAVVANEQADKSSVGL